MKGHHFCNMCFEGFAYRNLSVLFLYPSPFQPVLLLSIKCTTTNIFELFRFRFIGMILRHMGSVNEPEVVGKDWGKNLELQDCARGFVK